MKLKNSRFSSTLRMYKAFMHDYPRDILKVFFLLLAAALFEGLGAFTVVPLAGAVVGGESGTGQNQISEVAISVVQFLGFNPSLGLFISVFAILLMLKGVILWFVHTSIGSIQAKIETEFRVALMEGIVAAEWQYVQSQPSGHLTNAVTTEALRAASNFTTFSRLAMSVVQAVVYTAAAFIINAYVAFAALVTGVILFLVLSRYVSMTRTSGAKRTEKFKVLLARFTDIIRGLKPLKAMSLEQWIVPLVEADAHEIEQALRREASGRAGIASFQEPIGATVLAGGLYFMLTYTDIDIAIVIAMAFLFWRSVQANAGVQRDLQALAANESAYWSIKKAIIDAKNAKEELNPKGEKIVWLQDSIRLEGVDFSYTDQPILQNINFEIPAGKITAVIGQSGSGKTTIADLILGLYALQNGRISIDGRPLATINLKNWRSSIGYVPQDPILLNGSIYDNISLGNPDITRDMSTLAVTQAGALNFINQLSDGIDTIIGEGGQALSGGQRQRLAIARALVAKPTLLILDEFTSSLDAETEQSICSTLLSLRQYTTIFAISHQSAIREIADQVFLLDETGLHDEAQSDTEKEHRNIRGNTLGIENLKA